MAGPRRTEVFSRGHTALARAWRYDATIAVEYDIMQTIFGESGCVVQQGTGNGDVQSLCMRIHDRV